LETRVGPRFQTGHFNIAFFRLKIHKNNIFICFEIYFQHHHIKTIQKYKKNNLKLKKSKIFKCAIQPQSQRPPLVLVWKYG